MDQDNPYRSPNAALPAQGLGAAGRWRISTLVLVAVQTLLYLFNGFSGVSLVQEGDISVLAFLASLGAGALLGAGGAMLGFRSRAAIYLFAASTLLAALAMLQWRTPIAITGLGIALIATLVSVRVTSSRTAPTPSPQ